MAEIRKEEGRKYWQAIYYERGVRKFRSTKTKNKRLAQAVADQYEREANTPGDAPPDPTTIDYAVDEMLKHFCELVQAGKRSPSTTGFYERVTGHLKRVFSTSDVPHDIAEIDAEAVDKYISKRRGEGARESTISKELVGLRRTLRLMKRRGRWRGDLQAVLPYRFAPEYVPRDRFLRDMGELRILLANLVPDHAARAAFEVATSANLGESHAALRADLDTVPVLIRGTKRLSRWRYVPIVTDWQRDLLDFAKANAKGVEGAAFRFDAGYHGALRAACKDAKLPHTTSNDLRRTFCHWMKDAGVPRELVAAAMGHLGTQMVDKVYGKPTPEELQRQMLRALGGTTVAQINADGPDDTDGGGGKKRRKSAKSAGGGDRTRAPLFAAEDFKSRPKYDLTARAYKKNRDYGVAAGTTEAQSDASSERA